MNCVCMCVSVHIYARVCVSVGRAPGDVDSLKKSGTARSCEPWELLSHVEGPHVTTIRSLSSDVSKPSVLGGRELAVSSAVVFFFKY